jgi:serine/threonine protein phosphatase 1
MLDFHPDVAEQYLRLDLDAWDDVYVVGDVHGCRESLDRLLATLDVDDDDLVVFVGDLIRKGPDSAGVIELLRRSPNMFSVRGNNEEKVLRGETAVEGLDEDHREWLRSLPVAIGFDGGLVVHAGVDPRKALAEHTVDDLQNVRSLSPAGGYEGPFWYDDYEGPPRVFFGHTVLERPLKREWAVGLDTGCVYGGSLTAYDVRNGRYRDVPSKRGGVSRSDSKIISPDTSAD